jgi:hypothetical protein
VPIFVPPDEWLVLDKVDCLLDCLAASRVMPRPGGVGQCHRGVPERAGVGDGDEQAEGDGKEGAWRGQQWWGVGMGKGEYRFYICLSIKGPFSQIKSLVIIMVQATMTANLGGPAPAASSAGCA